MEPIITEIVNNFYSKNLTLYILMSRLAKKAKNKHNNVGKKLKKLILILLLSVLFEEHFKLVL
jgi:hypothetical protein